MVELFEIYILLNTPRDNLKGSIFIWKNKEKWKSQGHKNRGPQSEEAKLKISKAFSEMIWINNGKENRRINKNKEIPCGYVKGRLRNGS